MSIGESLNKYIEEKVSEMLRQNKFPYYDDVYTDTFGELIDRLTIINIRYWYLEDAMTNATTDKEMIKYRKKAAVLFQEKRPMLVKAIDKLFVKLVENKLNYTPSNTKKYG